MPRTPAAKKKSVDHLRKLANALDDAVVAAKNGRADSHPRTHTYCHDTGTLAHLVFSSSYALSYGIAFPFIMIAASVPANNAAAQGLADGARAARSKVDAIKARASK